MPTSIRFILPPDAPDSETAPASPVTGGKGIYRYVRCADVKVPERFRKDMGDIVPLANSIQTIGQLQPIGVTPQLELIYGERRLQAVRDVLGREKIAARIANIDDLLLAQHDENEFRKDFTVSERVAIAQVMEAQLKKRQGERRDLLPHHAAEVRKGVETRNIVAKGAGFGSHYTKDQAEAVVKDGTADLVDAMDQGEVSISKAAEIAKLAEEKQGAALDEHKRAKPKRRSKRKPNGKAKAASGDDGATEPVATSDEHETSLDAEPGDGPLLWPGASPRRIAWMSDPYSVDVAGRVSWSREIKLECGHVTVLSADSQIGEVVHCYGCAEAATGQHEAGDDEDADPVEEDKAEEIVDDAPADEDEGDDEPVHDCDEEAEPEPSKRQAQYKITLTVPAARQASVVKKLMAAFGSDMPIHAVEKLTTAESRPARLAEAGKLVGEAAVIVGELACELEQWSESMPENLQCGSKAREVDEAKGTLEELQAELEGLDFGISFPGMY